MTGPAGGAGGAVLRARGTQAAEPAAAELQSHSISVNASDVFSPPEAPYVNTRRGSMLGSPYRDHPTTSFGDARPATPPQPALSQVEEDAVLRRTPSPRVSQHPSVAALYQYAQEVCTPVSCNSKPVRSSTPPECAELVSALEGAAQGVDADASGGELCSSFGSWLAGMGLDAGVLPASALAKMQVLWEKAKEAMQLQTVVEQLKEAELQLAQQEAEDNARHVGILLAENETLLGTKAQLQEQLVAAERRLAQLATAVPVPTPHTKAAPTTESSPGAAVASEADSPAKAHSWAYGEQRQAASMSVGQCPAGFGTMPSPSTAAFAPAASPQPHRNSDGAANPVTSGAASGAASGFSISLGSLAQPGAYAGSPAQKASPVPQSPSDSVNGPAAPAGDAATPGLSFTSAVSQLPFGAWGAGGGFGGNDLGAVASPAPGMVFGSFSAAGGFGGIPVVSPNEVQSGAAPELLLGDDHRQAPLSWPLSPGMAVSSYSAQTEQVQAGAGEGTSSGAGVSAQPTPTSRATPQLSAGLSTVSRQQPPAVGYESWCALQEMQSPEAAGALPSSLAASPASVQAPATAGMPSSEGFAALLFSGATAAVPSPQPAGATPSPQASGLHSPHVSAGLSVVSRSPAPVPFGAWSNAQQDDGTQGPADGVNSSAAARSQSAFAASPGSFVSTPALSSSPAVASPLPSTDAQALPCAAAASTAGAAAGRDSPSASAQLRSNPLFEYEMESPAPHTPLPTRIDGMLGPLPAPEPSPEPEFPSLASTPMTHMSAAVDRSLGSAVERTAEPMDYSPAPAHLPFGLTALMESPVAAASGTGSPGPLDSSYGADFDGGFGGGFAVAEADFCDDLGDMPSPPAASALSLPAPKASPVAAQQLLYRTSVEACLPVDEQIASVEGAAEESSAEVPTAAGADPDAGAADAFVDADAEYLAAAIGAATEVVTDVVAGEGAVLDSSQQEVACCSSPAERSDTPAAAFSAVPELVPSAAAADAEHVDASAEVAVPPEVLHPQLGPVQQAAKEDVEEQPEVMYGCANEPGVEDEDAAADAAETAAAAAYCPPEPASPAAGSYIGLGDVGSPPCCGAVPSPLGSVQASALSPVQSLAPVDSTRLAGEVPPLDEGTAVAESSSPARPDAARPAAAEEQCLQESAFSPPAEQQAPADYDLAANTPVADVMSPVPAASSFEPPASSASSAVKPSTPGGGEGCADADGGPHSYPNTPSGAWPASPTSTMYATPLEAFATPHSLASFYTAAHMTALRMLSAVQTPATGANGNQATPGIPTPVASFSFGMMGPAAGAAGYGPSAAGTPALGRGFPVMAGGSAGATRDAALPGFGLESSPAEMQAFAGAAGGVGFGSPLPLMALTPVHMRTLDDLASQVLAAMSPSLLARGSAELVEDSETEASAGNSPEEVGRSSAERQGEEHQHASPAAATLRPAIANPITFGGFAQLLSQLHSPLPVAHRREPLAPAAAPVAGGANSGDGASAASESKTVSPPTAAVAAPAFVMPGSPAAFNFAQLLTQLHSPMPLAHMPQRAVSCDAATAPAEASTPSPPAASGPSQNPTAVPTSPAAFNLAAMLAHLQSPLPQPVAARRMAGGGAAGAAAGAAAPSGATAADMAAAPAPPMPGSPAAFNFAQLLSQLHSPLPMPMHRLSRVSTAASQPSSAQAMDQPQEQRSETEPEREEHPEQGASSEATAGAHDAPAGEVAACSMQSAVSEPVTVADAMPNFAKLMAFLTGGGKPPASPAPARAAAQTAGANSAAEVQDGRTQGTAPTTTAAPVDEAAAAAAMFSFASLLAHLHSPMPNGAALALVPNPGAVAGAPIAGHSLRADAGPGAALEADSPAAMAGAMSQGAGAQQDSPANSEAASFGFSTAAKLSTRVTPSTTPGGGNASFMRWAKETAPPTFRLDSDVPGGNGRSRLSRTPPTPVSFSFGAPGAADEGATPVAHGGYRGRWGTAGADAEAVTAGLTLAQPAEQHIPTPADAGPRSPVVSLGFNFGAAADGSQSPAFIFGNAAAAAAASPHSPVFMLSAADAAGGAAGAMPHSPMFMMAAPSGGGGALMPHSPMFMMAAAAGQPSNVTANAPHSPAFSFGHAADISCPMTPGFVFADSGAAAAAAASAASPQSPAFTLAANGVGAAAPHSPAFSFGNQLAAAATTGAAACTPVAFLGGRAYVLARVASTPTAARGSAGGDADADPAGTPVAGGAAMAGAVPPSPTPSLGFWMMVPRGGASGVPGSPAPSDMSFAFGEAASGACVVGTPVLGGMMPGHGVEHMSPVAAGAAWQQVVAASPIWGLAPAAESEGADTPGSAARPASAAATALAAAAAATGIPAFWSSLLGNLHSPMPMMLNPRRSTVFQQPAASEASSAAVAAQLQAQLHFDEQPSEGQHSAGAVPSMDPPSLDTLPTATASVGNTGAPHGAAAQASGASAASTFSFISAAVPEPEQQPQLQLVPQPQDQDGPGEAVGGKEQQQEAEEDQDTPREAVLPPPSYEDLPDLIARGLCMSVPAVMAQQPPVVLPPPAESPVASALDACSSVGENPTPFSQRLNGIATASLAAVAAPDDKDALGGLLFTPVRRVTADTDDLVCGAGAAAVAAAPVLETLAVQSVSDSSRSGLDAQTSIAGVEAGRTTDDALAGATPSRLGPGLTAASGCVGAEADAPSVHSSPVFSFGQPASSVSGPSVGAATAAAPPRLVLSHDHHDDATGLSSPPAPGDTMTPVSVRPRAFGAVMGSCSPGLHVVMSPAAALLRRAAVATGAGDEDAEEHEAMVVVEMPDVRDSIRGFVNSANSTPQQPPSTGGVRDRADMGGNPFLFAPSGGGASPVSATDLQQQGSSASASINFSADAVQRLLFAAADAVSDSAAAPAQQQQQQPAAAAGVPASAAPALSAESSSYSCDSDIAPPPEEDDGTGTSGATPHMTYTITAAPGSPVLSSRPSVYAGLPTPGCLTPFSYMGPNSLPATPLTAELASAAKEGAGAAPAGSASASKAMGGGAAGRHHPQPFWAPSASGPVGGCMPSTNGERVTLEVLNRRICANADLLLDFQGSPGRQSMPGTSASGATPPRASTSAGGGIPQHRGPAALFISPGRKSSGGSVGATGAASKSILTNGAAAAPAPPAASAVDVAPARAAAAAAPAAVAAQVDAAAAAAAARTRLLLSGGGVPVQQLVAASLGSTLAAAGGAAPGAMNAAAAAHLPLSQRLGLWHAATLPAPFGVAAWGVPLAWPGMPAFAVQPAATGSVAGSAANPAPRGSGGSAAPVQQQMQQPQLQANVGSSQPQPQARPPPAPVGSAPLSSQFPAKPAVTSRDVQTTPSLAAKPNAAGTAHKPAFRSRIPTPGSSASSAAAGAAANAPASNSTATSGTSLVPAQPAAPASRIGAGAAAVADASMMTPVMPPRPAQSPSPGAASSDDESSLMLSSPVERVVRRRRLLTSAAAAGGPQRVPVAAKRPAAGPPGPRRLPGGGGGGGRTIGGIDEDEVRRRAHVLGMRISPYLRPKKK
ncbi:hypothetical protein HYH02_001360 [Chlamydomonas schloesseri]|uniref:Uncharacterized protein n=1 Tax=Chlamydomonas schloesseri TaxID=2026947 RepID=A0A835WU68_9CHLO|nr:hypothetical protein HYH02_001360 [Chlamydomonas schloesseri]|eukprot:KAG2454334.1 hypothetical protein HYH02_001360 [Chlamydomonas schloesseri]